VQGCEDKLRALQTIASEHRLLPEQIAYVGNDVNDLDCLRWAGASIAVADAVAQVMETARWSTTRSGGDGAVREVCDWILNSQRGDSHG
jgi:3-deoxy-D-manno-octulosonate 8-phosphate phosphatase (KDO 8-P phosphatase)